MEPLKRIDESTPIGTRVVVIADDGLLLTETAEKPQRRGIGCAEVALRSCAIRVPCTRVFLLPAVQS